MVSRLTQAMVKVIQADLVSIRGMRNVIDGEAELLLSFEFNMRGKLGTTMFAPFTSSIDRVTGELTVDIPSFVPANMIVGPAGTTHYRVVSGGAEVDFENETYTVSLSETTELLWDSTPSVAISQMNQVGAASSSPLFIALGIIFYQEVNGKMYTLKNGAHNPLSLIQISGL